MKFTRYPQTLGTIILILFGCGLVTAVGFFGHHSSIPVETQSGDYISVSLWGGFVALLICITGTISVACLATVTDVFIAIRGVPWFKVQVPAPQRTIVL
jgi:glycerol uptake facilitator-like aquaporin